ncbi:NAD-dependent DNA ligase LigA, partial [Halobium palmae]
MSEQSPDAESDADGGADTDSTPSSDSDSTAEPNPDADDNPYLREPPTEFEDAESLTAEDAEAQAERLREAIREHDRRYYVENDPLIADRAYDALFARLEALEDAFDLDATGSPTRRVGGEPLDELETVDHVAPMLS